MRFSNLFLGAVFAVTSVAAMANPAAEAGSLMERSKHHHDCGKHASYNTEKKECVCHVSGETYHKKHHKCKKPKEDKKHHSRDVLEERSPKKDKHEHCGKHASFNEEKKECVCHDKSEVFEKHHKKCKKAKDEKKKDDDKKKDDKKTKSERDVLEERDPKKDKHHNHCGKHASYSEEKKECVCHNKAEVFERKHKKCKKHISLRSIFNHCGRHAYYDEAKKECICHDAGKDFLKKHKTCACPQGEKWHHIERKCKA